MPFLLWSIFYSVVAVARNLVNGEAVDWWRLISRILAGKASTPFYYILVLLQLTILAPIIVKIVREKKMLYKAMWWLTPVYLFFVYYDNIVNGGTFNRFGTPFMAWFIFFFLGLDIQIHDEEWARRALEFGRCYYVLGALILSAIEGEILITLGCKVSFASSQIRFTTFLYVFVIIIWFYRRGIDQKKTIKGGILSLIGDCSYGIFYIHCFVLIIVEKAISMIVLSENWFLPCGICFVITVIMSTSFVVIVTNLFRKYSKFEKVIKVIGF